MSNVNILWSFQNLSKLVRVSMSRNHPDDTRRGEWERGNNLAIPNVRKLS